MKTHFVVRISTYIDAVDYDEKARREMIHREVIQAVSFNAAKRQATKIFEAQPICETIQDAWGKVGKWSNDYNSATKDFGYWEKQKVSRKINVYLTVFLLADEYRFGLSKMYDVKEGLSKALDALNDKPSTLYRAENDVIEMHPEPYKTRLQELTKETEQLLKEFQKVGKEYREYVDSLTNLKDN